VSPVVPSERATTPCPVTDDAYWDAATAAFIDPAAAGRTWRQHCDELHDRLLSRWSLPEPGGRVLKTDLFDEAADAGLAPRLTSTSADVFGMDISAEVLDAARRRHPGLRVTHADVRRLPFRDSSFDLIVSNSTLDHFPSDDEIVSALRELHRVTVPGGRVVVSLDNLFNPVIAIRSVVPFRLLRALGLVPYYVGATFSGRRLSATMRAVGFDVTRTATFMHVPRVLAVPWCSRLDDRVRSGHRRQRTLRRLGAWERLDRLPTRSITAHYVAVEAVRP
jgi:SAM-dependent methyltransferase